MSYLPGDTAYFTIPVQDGTGARTNATSTPVAVVRRNGTVDVAVSPTVATSGTTGLYNGSFTIPTGYAAGDTVDVLAYAVVGGVTGPYVTVWRQVLDSKRLFNIVDINGRVDIGKWIGVAPAALTSSGYIQTTLRRWLTDDAAGTPAALSATGKFIQAMLTRWKTDDSAGTPSDLDTNRVQTKVGAVATDAIDAAALKTDAVTKIQTGLAKTAEVQLTVNPTPVSGGFLDADRERLGLTALETNATANKGAILDAIDAIEIGTGTGARTLTFTVRDGEGNPIERATVRVTAGLITKRDVTGADGTLEIPVNDGTWHFAVDKSGYDGVTGTRVVATDLAISATLAAVVLPLPASPDLVTVYGSYGFLNVVEAGVTVTAIIKGSGVAFLNHTLQNQDRAASTATSEGGGWSLDLAPLPDDHYWELGIGTRKLKLVVPNTPGETVNVEGIITDVE